MKDNRMKRLADRRTILLAAATVVVAHGALADTAQSSGITIRIGFEGGKPIPKGGLVTYVKGSAGRQRRAASTTIESNGKSREISLSLPLPTGADMSSPQQIVAELHRTDGWLLARGSAQVDRGLSAAITLYTVMY
jgi:hypothetical protein